MRRPIYQTALSCSKLRLKPGCDTEAAGWVSRRRLFKPHVDRPLRFVGGRNRCAATLLAAFERLNVGAMIGGNKDGFSLSSLEHCLLAADRVTAGLYHGVLDLDSIDSAGSAMIDHARETLCDNGWSQLPLSDVDYDLYKRKFAGYVPPDPVESNNALGYRKLVGELLWPMRNTSPAIAAAMSTLSKCVHRPSMGAWLAALHSHLSNVWSNSHCEICLATSSCLMLR